MDRDAPHVETPASDRIAGIGLEWILRPLFGVLLAIVALAAMVGGGAWFAVFIAAGTIAGVREWHRMLRHGGFLHYVFVSGIAIAAALALPVVQPQLFPAISVPLLLSLEILAAAAVINFAIAAAAKAGPVWQGFGPLYLGIPGLAVFALRAVPEHGLPLVLTLFMAVWATDTGALIGGKLIGGPKMAPVLSPNKTWAGFAGGTLAGAAIAAAIMLAIGANPVHGAVFGTVAALAAHGGDLFESWMKRGVGRKDSGHLIPGHGGVLDRIDSMLFAAPVCAAFVFLFGVHAVFGVQP